MALFGVAVELALTQDDLVRLSWVIVRRHELPLNGCLRMHVDWLSEGITAVSGVRVGHASDPTNTTGVTAMLFERAAVGGCDVRGGAASTRQFGSLDPLHVHGFLHAMVFAGGSAFGLDAGSGAVRYLEQKGVGLQVLPGLRVPVVPTAIILDVGAILGERGGRPDAAMGYAACETATTGPVPEGSVGAGTGAAVGKAMGLTRAMKGGLGTAAAELSGGGRVGALVVVNAFGDVVDPACGRPIAGLRESPDSRKLGSSVEAIVKRGRLRSQEGVLSNAHEPAVPAESTTLVLVATDVPLTRLELTLVSRLAGQGLVRSISPCHTPIDGDVVVAAGTSGLEIPLEQRLEGAHGARGAVDSTTIGLVAAEAVSRAVLRGVGAARGLPGLPGLADRQA